MIAPEDCIAMCGLTKEEVSAIAEHEHISEVIATAMARYLLNAPNGAEKIRDMMRADIHEALDRKDAPHASELLSVPREFLAKRQASNQWRSVLNESLAEEGASGA
jgi:hypothetical protein